SVSGTKTWANDDPETRPAYIDLVLLADGKQVANKRIYPNQDGSWPTHTFTGINKYRDHGIEIVYTVDEIVSDAAYVPTITGEGGAFDILNTYHPYGDVDLTKYVIGATAKVLNEDRAQSKQYQFQVKLEVPITDDEGNPILDDGKQVYGPLAGNYKLESRIGDADATDAGTISDGGTITITAGGSYTLEGVTTQVDPETITIKDLPNNTRVTFTEEDYSDEGLSTATGRVQTVIVTQNKTAKVTYTNVYRTKGQADLEAKKVLKGKTLEASMFNFELLDENGNLVGVQATNKANGTVTFGTIHYTASDDGKTYHYTIREIVPDEAKNVAGRTYAEATDAEKAAGGFKLRGIEYDQSEYGVTVTVNDVDGNGQLTVITKYDKSNAIPKFTNTYAAEGTVELVAWKTLEGRELQADEFSFELVPVSGKKADGTSIVATDIPMPLNDWGVRLSKDTQTNDDQGTVRFDSIKYTQADVGNTYYYVASEVVPTGADPDIEYDTSIFCYKVTIVDNGDGTLYADQSMVDVTKNESSYTIGSATEAQPEFVNKLKPGSLRLEKLIQGENPDPDQEFTFHVILKGDVDPEAFTVEYEEATGDPDQIRTQATRGNEEEEQDSLPAPLQFLHDLFTPTVAYAAEGNIKYSGTFADNLTWEFYEDGELVIRPTNGNDATWYRTEETTPPWLDVIPSTEQSNIKKITFKSTIHVVNTIQDLVNSLWQGNDSIEVLDISGLETSGVRSMRHAFSQLRGLTEIIGIDTLDTSNVGDMYCMFYDCPGLTELDVSHFDTSNVTQMDGMFQWCSSLAMLDVSGFDTSGVTSTNGMNMMFF
ncbi:MAG: BspA family leucine-rich repeat surface protein, partial [Atopobiaceae bacterium]|nr:BspA family leucine-rich repeat surface protein [Atopobiaceae bacterium]